MKHAARSAAGALVGGTIAALAGIALGRMVGKPMLLVPPIGASMVLVFAVTASPLAQPRAVIGGNVVSVAVGLAVAMLIPGSFPTVVIAVALAIAAMMLTDCVHPPGGASAALPALLGPPALSGHGLPLLALVAVNSCALVLAGWGFHNLTGHSYPHRKPALPELKPGWRPDKAIHLDTDRADILAVLDELEDMPDIGIDDLAAIIEAVEVRRAARA